MKDLILGIGESFLNITVFIVTIAVVIIGLVAILNQGFFYGVSIIVIGIIVITVSTYFIYLLIDIRDKSAKTNELLSKILEDKNKEL